jgi:hypothetical protein
LGTTVESAVKVYEALGFQECRTTPLGERYDSSLEEGYEKVAIYGDQWGYTHAARQLEDGKWASKIGELEDIEHDSPEDLTGSDYGSVVKVMEKRKR